MSISSDSLDFNNLTWKNASQTKGEKGVRVDVADVKGFDLKAIRASSTYKASIAQLRARIMDMENFHTWVTGAISSTVVKIMEDNAQACHCEYSAPWPLKNRDGVVVQQLVRIDENTVGIRLRANSTLIKEKRGVVRIEYLQGIWILQDIGDGKTELTYQLHSDPNGNIPDMLVNRMITEAPTNTLTNLHNVDFSIYSSEQLALAV